MDKFLVICNQPRLIQEERENLNSPISRNKIKFLIKKQKQTKCSKALPKVKLVPKKGHGYCSVVCCPSDPPQLSELQRNHYIWDVCSVSWWDAPKTARPRAGIDQEFSSVVQSCPTLADPMDWSTPGFPVHHQLPELAQTHVHRVSDAIQPSHPLPSPSPRTFSLSQFKSISSLLFGFLYSPTLTSIHDYWKNHSFD